MSKDRMQDFLSRTMPFLNDEKTATGEAFRELFSILAEQYKQAVVELYGKNRSSEVTDIELATLVNYNRELYTAKKSILYALSDLLLSPGDAAALQDLPGFIR